jgi:CheY-like chemotaxis protein
VKGERREGPADGSPLLAGLQAKFMPRMTAAVRRCLETCSQGLAQGDSRSVAAALHVVAGEASALGLVELASAAAEAEQRALAWQADAAVKDGCARAVSALAAVAERLEHPALAVAAEPSAAAAGERGRVLVVDDSALSAEAICDALDDAGLLAELALDLPAALAAMTEFRPAVVLTDVQMPGLDAPAVCRALRAAAQGMIPPPRVVLMSGASQDELAVALARTDADAGVSKHDGTSAIVQAVRAVLP